MTPEELDEPLLEDAPETPGSAPEAARESESLDEENRLKGDIKNRIYQEFDLIGFMETHYVMEGGQRERKHRIRWWPEPGYEMVRDRSNTLPQFTPVEFGPQDFQAIFDHLVSGVDELTESKVITEVQTEAEEAAASLPSPEEGAGPVADPKLPPAQRQPAGRVAGRLVLKNPALRAGVLKLGIEPGISSFFSRWLRLRACTAIPCLGP